MDQKLMETAALEKSIIDYLEERHAETRAKLSEGAGPGDGVKSRLGQAYISDPKDSWKVTDEAAFLAWVEANQPDEIVTTVQVNPAFRDWVLKHGGLRVGDDLEPVDGVSSVRGTPRLTLRPSSNARETAPMLVTGLLEEPSAEGWPIELEDAS